MNEDNSVALAALGQLLDLTDECDWHLLHATVRARVSAKKYDREFEDAYRSLVDKIAKRKTSTTGTPGWYEWNRHEETHWRVDEPVTHWMALPLPFNAGAQRAA